MNEGENPAGVGFRGGLGGRTIGKSDFMSFSASINVHLMSSDHADLYVAPTITLTDWGDLDLNSFGKTITSENNVDGDSAWGLSAGADIMLAERFAVVVGLRWVNMEITPADIGEIGVFPLSGRLGLALRW